jgi:hypothetical protein
MSLTHFATVVVWGLVTWVGFGNPYSWAQDGTRIPSAADRKVQKLKDGRITAYPELVSELYPYKEPAKEAVGKLVKDDPTVPADDIRRLRIEAFTQLQRVVELDLEVVTIGSWDEGFIIRLQADVEKLSAAAASAFPKSDTHLPWMRYCVAAGSRIESGVDLHMKADKSSMSKQHLLEATATRLRLESALWDAEVAASNPPKEAKPPGGERPVRKVQKPPAMALTAYPEFAWSSDKPYVWPTEEKIGKLVRADTSLPEGDIRRGNIEQLNLVYSSLETDRKKIDRYVYDNIITYRYLSNVERVSSAAVRAFPDSDRHLPWIRYGLASACFLEAKVWESILSSQSIRRQIYHRARATCLFMELALFDAEMAAQRKAASGR